MLKKSGAWLKKTEGLYVLKKLVGTATYGAGGYSN